MAFPAHEAKTAFASANTISVVVDFSTTGRVAGDWLVVPIHTVSRAVTAPAGWLVAPDSPQSVGSTEVAGAVRLSVFYKISDGTETTVTFTLSTGPIQAIGYVLSGVDPTAGINAYAGGVISTATTSIVCPSVTTTVNDCLIVNMIGNDRDLNSTTNLSSVANASLANVTLQHDQTSSTGAGGGIAYITGELATAGASGTTTATNAASNTYALLTLAFAPVAGTTVSITAASVSMTGQAINVAQAKKIAVSPATIAVTTQPVYVGRAFSVSAVISMIGRAINVSDGTGGGGIVGRFAGALRLALNLGL